MNHDRWRKIEQIYHEALRQDPARRARFVKEVCGSDKTLLREIESLLRHAPEADRFIERYGFRSSAPFLVLAGAGVIDQDAAHQSGRNGDKVRAVLPVELPRIDQPRKSLIDQGRVLSFAPGLEQARDFIRRIGLRRIGIQRKPFRFNSWGPVRASIIPPGTGSASAWRGLKNNPPMPGFPARPRPA